MKKRTIVLIAAVLAVVVALAAVGAMAYLAREEELAAAREKLSLKWEEYIGFRDQIDEYELWMLDHVEAYSEEKTWENLLRARAALAAGSLALQKIKTPDMQIDRSVMDKLPSDEDVVVAQMLSGAPGELESALSMVAVLQDTLEHDFLYDLTDTWLETAVFFYRRELTLSERSNASVTNHLLLKWKMKDRWETIAAQYPSFGSFMDTWESRDKVLEERTDVFMDEMETLYFEYANAILYNEMLLEMTEKAVTTGEFDELRSRIAPPAGMPATAEGQLAIFPRPSWLQEPSAMHYVTNGEDGSPDMVFSGDDLTKAPTGLMLYYDRVSREEYDVYFDTLRQMGFVGAQKDSEDGTSFMMVERGDYALLVQWSQFETVFMLSDPMGCLVTPLDYYLLSTAQ